MFKYIIKSLVSYMTDKNQYKQPYIEKILNFLYLKNSETYIAQINSGVGGTYNYVYFLIRCMKKDGLIIFNKIGRKNVVSLTKKGKELGNICSQITQKLYKKAR